MADVDLFSLEKEGEVLDRNTVTSSELESLVVDETLSDVDRSVMLLQSGTEIQKISVMDNLPKILVRNPALDAFCSVMSPIQDILHDREEHLPIATEVLKGLDVLLRANSKGKFEAEPEEPTPQENIIVDWLLGQFDLYAEENTETEFLLSSSRIQDEILPIILEVLAESEDKDILKAALKCLITIIPRLECSVQDTEIIPLALKKGEFAQGPTGRVICCKILGAVIKLKTLSNKEIMSLFFHKMIELCQDTDAEVRKICCLQLEDLARNISLESVSLELLPEILELMRDEEGQVAMTAFGCVISLYDLFKETDRTSQVVPAIIDLVKHPPEFIERLLSRIFGILLLKMDASGDLSNDLVQIFTQSFSALSRHSDPEIRRHCAFSFPGMFKSIGASRYSTQLDEVLQVLSRDEDKKVRLTVASGIHEIAQMLGPQRVLRHIKASVINLLTSEGLEVQSMMISRIPYLLVLFRDIVDPEQKLLTMESIFSAVVAHNNVINGGGKWRLQIVLINTLQHFPSCYSTSQIIEKITPILFEHMSQGCRPVQLAAIETLMQYCRGMQAASHRHEILNKIRTSFGNGKSYWSRCLYLEVCTVSMRLFSFKYFKTCFLEHAVELLEDPVPNVRLKAISLLPLWRKALKFPVDSRLVDRMRRFLNKAESECDRDVKEMMIRVREELSPIESNTATEEEEEADSEKMKYEDENSMKSDGEISPGHANVYEMLEYSFGKDGIRRQRVRSLDLAKGKIAGSSASPTASATSRGSSSKNYTKAGQKYNSGHLPHVANKNLRGTGADKKSNVISKTVRATGSCIATNRISSIGNGTKIPTIPTRPVVPSPHSPLAAMKETSSPLAPHTAHRPKSGNSDLRGANKETRTRVAPITKK